jgi:HK97 gp10 family phage protein
MTVWRTKIPATLAKSRKELSALIRASALNVEAYAKLRAPVRTGFLKNSIQTVVDGELTAVVFAAAEYAVYVELGAHGRAPRPFLLPALEQVAAEFKSEVVKR